MLFQEHCNKIIVNPVAIFRSLQKRDAFDFTAKDKNKRTMANMFKSVVTVMKEMKRIDIILENSGVNQYFIGFKPEDAMVSLSQSDYENWKENYVDAIGKTDDDVFQRISCILVVNFVP